MRSNLISTFAKGVTSGYQPLGGVIINRKVCDVLESDPDFTFMHGYTYSGHPAASAAAIANINIIEDEGLVRDQKKLETESLGVSKPYGKMVLLVK